MCFCHSPWLCSAIWHCPPVLLAIGAAALRLKLHDHVADEIYLLQSKPVIHGQPHQLFTLRGGVFILPVKPSELQPCRSYRGLRALTGGQYWILYLLQLSVGFYAGYDFFKNPVPSVKIRWAAFPFVCDVLFVTASPLTMANTSESSSKKQEWCFRSAEE